MKIEAPNGDIVEFPDGTPESTILEVMRREYGGPSQPSAPVAIPETLGAFTPLPERTVPGSAMAAPMAEPNPNNADVLRSFVTGLRRGAAGTFGIPGSIEQLGRMGINAASRGLTGGNAVSPETFLPTAAETVRREGEEPNALGRVVPYHEPQTTAGEFARTIGEFAPGAVLPGGLVQRALVNTTLPAVASEATGQALEGTGYETAGRVGAALLAPYAPRAAMRIRTPLPTDANRTDLVNLLEGEGVELTAGQRTGSRPLRWVESNARDMPFAGRNIADITERQGEQLTRAALRRTGTNAPDALATPPELAAARARIGAEFDRITANPLPLNRATSNQIATRLGNSFRNYLNTVPPAAQRPFVEGFLQDVLDAMTTPAGRLRNNIPGETIQHWRSRLSRMARETNDPEFAAFLNGARNTLDDIYGAALPAGDAAAWATARQQWRQLLILEDAVAGSAMGTPYGTVSPASLRRASRTGDPQAFAENRTPFSDLAHAAGTVMDSLPNSGTPARLAVGWAIPGMIAGSVGDAMMGTPGVGTLSGGAIANTLGPILQARAISNPRVQGYLGNQALAGPLNAGTAQPAGIVRRALMLPAQIPTLSGQ